MALPPTQDFLDFDNVREGTLILKNGDLRGIMMVSSMNFALKSDEEQTSIVAAFQSFLNSLDFPLQIIAQSRNINITPYMDMIKKLEDSQQNELLKLQTASYIEFIKELVKSDNVMSKSFFVVVPLALAEALGTTAATKQLNPFKKKGAQLKDEDFQRCRNQLWQRMEFVATGLKRCGLEILALNSAEIIELFWAIHHPNEAEGGYYPEIIPELLK